MHHYLKIAPQFFTEVVTGKKTAEIRFDDRNYRVGDSITFTEYDRERDRFTGDRCGDFIVTHVLRDFEGLKLGWVCLSLDWIEV
jgi:hypothetical protein